MESRVTLTLTVQHKKLDEEELSVAIESALLAIAIGLRSGRSLGEITECDVEKIHR